MLQFEGNLAGEIIYYQVKGQPFCVIEDFKVLPILGKRSCFTQSTYLNVNLIQKQPFRKAWNNV